MINYDFKTYTCDMGDGVTNLDHPLLQELIVPGRLELAQRKVEDLVRRVEAARSNGSWREFVELHLPLHRCLALLDIAEYAPSEIFWPLVGEVWVMGEMQIKYRDEWRKIFMLEKADRHLIMTEAEQQQLSALPDSFVIYRGYTLERDKGGFAWSTERQIAEGFASRWRRGGRNVIEREIRRDDARALFLRRGESEIIYLHSEIAT